MKRHSKLMVYKTAHVLFQGRRGLRVGTDTNIFIPLGTDSRQILKISLTITPLILILTLISVITAKGLSAIPSLSGYTTEIFGKLPSIPYFLLYLPM